MKENKRVYRVTVWGVFTLMIMAIIPFTLQASDAMDRAFKELGGTIVLNFRDAVSDKPISDARVVIQSEEFSGTAITDSYGCVQFDVDLIDDIDDGILQCSVSKKGYIPINLELPVLAGSIWKQRFYLSRVLPVNKVRFVLQWDNRPADLDLHLLIDKSTHISYRNTRSVKNLAMLDRDDRDGNGPETITLDRLEKNRDYQVYVYNYSAEQGYTGDEKILVYANNRLNRVIRLGKRDPKKVVLLDIADNMIQYRH